MSEAADDRPALTVQSVVYGNEPARLRHSASCLARSVELAQRDGLVGQLTVRIGDCSPQPMLGEADVARLAELFAPLWGTVEVEVFGANLGSAAGHNRLFGRLGSPLVLVVNPDVLLAPDTIGALVRRMQPGVGVVEARQVPLEHPKDFDTGSGDTSWASTACALVRTEVVRELDGFDAASFFLYCDDVDFSWRARLAGHRVVHEPAARVFHDKRLQPDGSIQVSWAEVYYSAEAALVLAHKYCRPDLVAAILADLGASPRSEHRDAVAEFHRRRGAGNLPDPIDAEHRVAEFVAGMYAVHRF